MARLRRFKTEGCETWFHLSARVAALRGEHPLAGGVFAERLRGLIQHYTRVYFCSVAGFCVMGNHYHLIVHFEEPREVDRAELERRANVLYPGTAGQRMIDGWGDERWQRFNERLFDVSELMRNIQGVFGSWYNRIVDRRGGFWADRFNSVVLGDATALLDCMVYVELNPCRASLVERPEDFRFSSLHLREIGEDDWLMPLREVIPEASERAALNEYRSMVYHRGAVPTKPGHAAISEAILEKEVARGFAVRGVFAKRLRHFSEGLAIGSQTLILEFLADLSARKIYMRRSNPIVQLGGRHHVLREQRRQRSPT